jgi:murein DD-endopeptidase MepM/ murein hydrolase activator NlpD
MARRKPYRQAVRPESTDTVHLRHWRGAAAGLITVLAATAIAVSFLVQPKGAGADVRPIVPAAAALGPANPGPLAPRPGGDGGAQSGPTHAAPATQAPATQRPAAGDGGEPSPPVRDPIEDAAPPASIAPTGSSGSIADAPPTSGARSVEPEQLTGYRWPIRKARMTSFFQPRDTGFLVVDGQRIHNGLDLATYCGDTIYAAHGGTVLAAGRRYLHAMAFNGPLRAAYARIYRRHSLPLMAITVVIDDGNGYRSLYAHLSRVVVKPGQAVRTGQVIGYEGATGDASGCHLHYEMIRMDGPWMRVAPERVKEYLFPGWVRERIDPLRVLSLKQHGRPRFIPGVNPPRVSPGLGRATAHNPHDR